MMSPVNLQPIQPDAPVVIQPQPLSTASPVATLHSTPVYRVAASAAGPHHRFGSSNAHSPSWKSNLFNCLDDMHLCLFGAFCECCLASRLAMLYGDCFCLPCLPGAMCALRSAMRERFQIPGTVCNDYCTVLCCFPCSLCQMARELQEREWNATEIKGRTSEYKENL
ncbi:cornifelin homolog B-like isoform X2 [Protopterus annectens]|uniref:cornifelin homolog B-like isoform X2 n=1 Tax=Protopterus annectens TaxID=7888 RepID=UPI001CF941EF|nr:cornifelin homolog B-like isoform X2 [Protopterus annectens]